MATRSWARLLALTALLGVSAPGRADAAREVPVTVWLAGAASVKGRHLYLVTQNRRDRSAWTITPLGAVLFGRRRRS